MWNIIMKTLNNNNDFSIIQFIYNNAGLIK